MRAVAAVLLGLLACACGERRAPDIIVVVGDALRADRLGSYGSERRLTPVLDAFAARATVVRSAYAQSSWTAASVASILSSRYQSQHGVTSLEGVISEAEITLPEVLKQHGYATGAVSANFGIPGARGYGQGFELYQTYWQTVPPADTVTRDALAWIDGVRSTGRSSPPLFLYLQYMETHTPYYPSDAALARAVDGRAPPDMDLVRYFTVWGNAPRARAQITPELRQGIRDAYDAMVVTLDEKIGALFGELERRGVLDNAVVVVTADHGEELLDHGLIGHGATLYNELIHVPLIVRTPDGNAPRHIDDVVSLIDVAPTLLELAGAAPPATFEGRSFAGRLRGDHASGAAAGIAYSELIKASDRARLAPDVRAVVVGSEKLIVGIDGSQRMYRLDLDPGEQHPLDTPGASLQAALAAAQQRAARNATAPAKQSLDAETRDRLRALGYTE